MEMSKKMKALIIVLATIMIAACTGESTALGKGGDGFEVESNAEIVDAATYFQNIPQYEGRPVYLYLNQVHGPTDKYVFSTNDHRESSPYGLLKPSEDVLKKWTSAGLDPNGAYTVTFRVKATDIGPGKNMFFTIEFDRFIVNTEDGPKYGIEAEARKIVLKDGLPVERARLPLAKTAENFEAITLYPEKYVGGRVRASVTVFKRDLQTFDEKHWVVRDRDISVLLPKQPVERKFPVMPDFFTISFTGRLDSIEKGLRLTIDEVRFNR